jgi:hypothetical protein
MRANSSIRRSALIVIAAVLTLPAGAPADVIERDRSRDVRAPGLTAKERNALDIVRIKATGVSFGVMVTATMRGNVERALGRGHLKRAVVALVLDATSRRRRDGVIAVGDRRGRQTAANFAPQSPYAVTVDGRRVTFIGVGVDLDKVRAMKVVTSHSVGGGNTRARPARLNLRRAIGGALLRAITRGWADRDALDVDRRVRRELTGSFDADCRVLRNRRFGLAIAEIELQQSIRAHGRTPILDAVHANVVEELADVDAEIARRCDDATIGPSDDLALDGSVSFLHFNPDHVRVDATARAPASGGARAAASTNPVDLVEFTLPPASDGTPRQATNAACGPPLETTEISGNKVSCSGGSLPLGQTYSAAIQTSPSPTHGMGMQVRARQDGQFHGPAQLAGPARSCGFSFNRSGASHLVLWECSEAHSSIRFDFNVGVQKQDTGTDCQVDSSDSSVVNCSGPYEAFKGDGFTVNFASGTCDDARFTAQATFAPGDVQTFPEKACGG